jgi:hypothetical protein
MKLLEMAISRSVVCALESYDIMTVDNSGSGIRMLIIPTIHNFVCARLDQTVSSGNKPWTVA